MKWLLVTADFPPRPGGMARYNADLARGLGPACTVAVGSFDGAPPAPHGEAVVLELPFDARASHRLLNRARARGLLATRIQSDRPDVLIAGNLRPLGPTVAGLARGAALPFVQIHHGGDLLQAARKWRSHPIKRRRWRRLITSPHVHAVNSGYTARLAADLGLPSERIAIVPPEVDAAHFAPRASGEARRERRRALGFGDDVIIALFVGRLVERKGLGDLFAALRLLLDSRDAAVAGPGGSKLQLVVAGPGESSDASSSSSSLSWERRASEAGVADHVRFVGPVAYSDLPDLYGAADLFVGPSRDTEAEDDPETFGIVFLEAAASGLPVLATRTGGIPEAVDEGESALLVEPGDVAALAAAWRRLAGDETLRRTLGRAGLAGPATRNGVGTTARALERALSQRLEGALQR